MFRRIASRHGDLLPVQAVTADEDRADATDLVALAKRKEPESLLGALVRRMVLASGIQSLWIDRRGLWLRWVPFSIVRVGPTVEG